MSCLAYLILRGAAMAQVGANFPLPPPLNETLAVVVCNACGLVSFKNT